MTLNYVLVSGRRKQGEMPYMIAVFTALAGMISLTYKK